MTEPDIPARGIAVRGCPPATSSLSLAGTAQAREGGRGKNQTLVCPLMFNFFHAARDFGPEAFGAMLDECVEGLL